MKYFSSSATEVSCEDIHPWEMFAICEEQNFLGILNLILMDKKIIGLLILWLTFGLFKVLASNDHIINNKKIDPKKAKARHGKIFVGGLSAELSDDDIKNYFSQYGTVSSLTSLYYLPARLELKQIWWLPTYTTGWFAKGFVKYFGKFLIVHLYIKVKDVLCLRCQ